MNAEGRPGKSAPQPNSDNRTVTPGRDDSVAFVLPTVPEDAPHTVREGMVRRRLVAVTGECPCGATRPPLPNRAERRAAVRRGEVIRLRVEHENDCPAIEATLVAAIRRWQTA